VFLRHPALHFVVLGALLAAAILIAKGPPTGEETRRVVVTGSDLAQLRARFQRTWQRPPTEQELRGALEQFIRQEVLYREALARGYDRDDLVVRRAMQQKMEFLAQSQATREPPTVEEVEAYFTLRQERYRTPAVVSFAQVFVNPDAHESDVEDVAAALLERLRREDPDPSAVASLGDPIMLRPAYSGQNEQDLRSQFGESFAKAVLAQELGAWEGPVRSGYGLHLVKVLSREDSRTPDWREVAQQVVGDMEYDARAAAKEQLYQEIAQTYQVVLDPRVRELLEAAAE
jgi:parvulin-like peptidyl-prolyl isomerase